MRNFTIYDILQKNARIFANETGLVGGDVRLTFAEFLNQVDSLAAGLAAHGVSKGDRIGILALNDYRFFLLFGAAAALGAIVSPVNWRLSNEEINYILKDSAPKVLVVDSNHTKRIGELVSDVVPAGNIFCMDPSCKEAPSLDDLISNNPPGSKTFGTDLTMDDPFFIIYTAAVEGKPRGAVLTHGNIVFGNIQTSATMELTRRDAFLNMLPLFHITGLNLAMSVMHMGGKNVVVSKFNEQEALEHTQKEKISVLGSFPPILSRLLAEAEKGSYDLSSLRHVMGIDGPDNIKPFEAKTNSKFWILYGQSETSGLVTFSPAMEREGSAGKQGLLTKVKIVDESDNDLPVGKVGEIVVQGPLVFQGYWRQDELNRRTFRNGWHHTGDLGRLDEDGYLWFAGRKPEKELIKPGGENVYPAEVEEVILQHPDVEEVSVIGIPDSKFGEGVKAVCVLKEGTSMEAKELKTFVASRIASYKKPGYIEFVNSLPKTPGGTIDRLKVKELYGKA